MDATTKTPTNKRTAFAWARRNLVRQIRSTVAATPTEYHGRYGVRVYCRHERDARNVARGYLSDDFLDSFPEIELDGNWPRIAAQMVSYANDFFAQYDEGDPEVLMFHTCLKCDNYR
jgi:hypothetical protein